MTNVYMPTKGGELIRLTGKLAQAGFTVPPTKIFAPPFDSKRQEIMGTIQSYKDNFELQGPYAYGLMVRNNGSPRGTGEGCSQLVCFEYCDSDSVIRLMDGIQRSDRNAQGVILQPAVGQLMGVPSNQYYLPILSGIAYAASATERGNAIVEWVPGSPVYAVNGLGNYVAFNKETMEDEMGYTDFSKWKGPKKNSMGYSDICLDYIFRDIDSGGFYGGGGTYITHTIRELDKLGRSEQKTILKKLFESVLALEEPFYLEWAMTYIAGKIDLFALQIAEFGGKLAGLPTWLHDELHDMSRLLRSVNANSKALENLKALFSQALEDKQTIAAGFDVVGKGKQEFETVLWKPSLMDSKMSSSESTLLVLGNDILLRIFMAHISPSKMGGIVEIDSARGGDTFRGHMRGFCEEHNLLGLGEVKNMDEKLLALLPEKYAHFWGDMIKSKSRLLIKGKFVLDVDEGIPFGTLKVEQIYGVEKLAD